MSNRKGKPENFGNQESQNFSENLSFRVTQEMKEAVKAQENPAQFCRDAIQEKLDKSK